MQALILYFGVAALPSLLLFLYLLIEGSVANFWFYFISNARAHIGSYSIGSYITYFILELMPFFLKFQWYDSIFIISFISLLLVKKLCSFQTHTNSDWIFSCIFFFSGIWAITQSRSMFFHYILFLVVPALILVNETLVVLSKESFKAFNFNGIKIPKKLQRLLSKENVVVLVGVCLSMVLFRSFSANVSTQTIFSTKTIVGRANPFLTEMSQYVVENTDKDDYIVVWGWEQRVLVLANRKSGTAQTDIQRLYPPYSERNIDMYIADIQKNKPKLIVDVVAPGSFNYFDKEIYSLEKHERVWAAIQNDYELTDVLASGDSTYRVYLRKI